MNKLPELLAPAGNLEKLKVAVLYGADAVYLSGQRFGMRAGADNFTNSDLERGVIFAKQRGVKIYVTLNTFFHDSDFEGLLDYCQFLESQGVDGVIVSDLGVVHYINQNTKLEVHVSTQSSCLNKYAAQVWKELGATRIVVGRELSIQQTKEIKDSVGIEVEMFIHGAMCMAYSGNCVISNFTAGRDSNRGGCIQSCRYPYKQVAKKGLTVLDDRAVTSHFISSKDMSGAEQVPLFISAGIDSLKIEGRMKSPLYVATTTASYRAALDAVAEDTFSDAMVAKCNEQLDAMPHRDYIPGSFESPAPDQSTYEREFGTTGTGTHTYAGLVLDADSDLIAIRSQASLSAGSLIEFLTFTGETHPVQLNQLYDCRGNKIQSSKPGGVFCIRSEVLPSFLKPYMVVRGLNAAL